MSVVCPFCRTAFAPADIHARRTPCPNCGESVPLTTAAPPPPAQPAADAARLANPPSGGLVFLSLGLTALIVAGFAVWWFYFNTPQPPATVATLPGPPATLPPAALTGLKYIPKDSQVVAAVQPSALWQYADRTGQSADALLTGLGVPKELLDQLRDAGLPPDRIHHLIAAAAVDDLKLVLVLVLREPLQDDARFRKALKVKGQKVELDGLPLPLPLLMAKADDTTYLFSLNETDLGTAKAPHAGLAALPQGVRESVAKVSPAAFGWVATDAKDWAGVKLLQLPVIPAELSGKLAGVQAFAAGVSLEPDLQLKVAVRTNDSTLARTTAAGMKERLAELNPTVAAADEWAEATVALHPPKETLPKLKAALR